MDNQYFKNLERYNRSEKLKDPNILQRLEHKLRMNKPFLKLNSVIDYIIHQNHYIVMIDEDIKFYGNTIKNHKRLEVVYL